MQLYGFPKLVQACLFQRAACAYRRFPVLALRGQQLQCRSVVRDGAAGTLGPFAVGFVDHNVIRQLHHSPLDALKLVACAGNQHQQEEIHHVGRHCLRLPHPHRLHEHSVAARRLKYQNHFSRSTGGSAELALRRRRAHEGMFALHQAAHAGFIAHDGTAADGA